MQLLQKLFWNCQMNDFTWGLSMPLYPPPVKRWQVTSDNTTENDNQKIFINNILLNLPFCYKFISTSQSIYFSSIFFQFSACYSFKKKTNQSSFLPWPLVVPTEVKTKLLRSKNIEPFQIFIFAFFWKTFLIFFHPIQTNALIFILSLSMCGENDR